MCYIPHQKSKVQILFLSVFQAHSCGSRDLFNEMKRASVVSSDYSLISVKEKFSALSQRLDLISFITNDTVF